MLQGRAGPAAGGQGPGQSCEPRPGVHDHSAAGVCPRGEACAARGAVCGQPPRRWQPSLGHVAAVGAVEAQHAAQLGAVTVVPEAQDRAGQGRGGRLGERRGWGVGGRGRAKPRAVAAWVSGPVGWAAQLFPTRSLHPATTIGDAQSLPAAWPAKACTLRQATSTPAAACSQAPLLVHLLAGGGEHHDGVVQAPLLRLDAPADRVRLLNLGAGHGAWGVGGRGGAGGASWGPCCCWPHCPCHSPAKRYAARSRPQEAQRAMNGKAPAQTLA